MTLSGSDFSQRHERERHSVRFEGIIEKDPFVPSSYCHQKFQAMEEQTLDNAEPVLKNSTSGDVVDFYGACNESPVRQDQVQEQPLGRQHRWADNYED